jgi:DNA-binding CsgD family transcriptional regulator
MVETATLDGLLNAVREGLSRTLVLRGEPGIGKTALLEYTIQSATDFRLTRALGIESEMEFSFAGLHQLLVPFLPRLRELPGPQQDALQSAFGLVVGAAPDRFQVGLATLTLLAAAAAEQPLLCVVDDAQWLDLESGEVLAFVARRLYADRIALLFAVRDGAGPRRRLEGLSELFIDGIPEADARELLASVVAGPLDSHVADRIIAATRGNPLALLELTSDLAPAQLRGTSMLPEPLPIGAHLQEMFFRRVKSLPSSAQTMLLLAAADPSGDPVLLWRAAKLLGLTIEAVGPAEAERLISVGPQIAFRHPLIRSAVYHSAPLHERRRIHEALAMASDPQIDPDRRAWHRATAALGPDEGIADELERSADRARQRGGHAATAAFLSRAAELTPDEHQRTERMLAAVEAELISGATNSAQAILLQVTPRLVDPTQRARGLRLQGALRWAEGQLADAPSLLLQAARMLGPLDPQLSTETMLEALQAALYGGQFARDGGAKSVAREALSMSPGARPHMTISDLLLSGFTTLLTEGRAAAFPDLRRAVATLQASELPDDDDLRWFMLGCLAASELWDDQAQHALASRWVGLARDRGALTALPVALNYLGWYEVTEGRLHAAETTLAEGREISRAIGNPGIVGASGAGELLRLVWRGREAPARAAAAALSRDAIERGQGAGLTHAQSALAILELSLGNYQAALECARDVYDENLLFLGTLTLPDLVEAGVRGGDREMAADALDRFRERALLSGTQWALGLLARSQALLIEDAAAEDSYIEAIERLQTSRATTDLARAYLLYGEWLRRQGRKRDARMALRTAHETLDSMGAAAFAERARNELLATGEHARQRTVETRDDLTPQEAQIARLAGEGLRNPEIASRLFISGSTVEYHLVKVFRKLGVRSRTELAHALPQQA